MYLATYEYDIYPNWINSIILKKNLDNKGYQKLINKSFKERVKMLTTKGEMNVVAISKIIDILAKYHNISS